MRKGFDRSCIRLDWSRHILCDTTCCNYRNSPLDDFEQHACYTLNIHLDQGLHRCLYLCRVAFDGKLSASSHDHFYEAFIDINYTLYTFCWTRTILWSSCKMSHASHQEISARFACGMRFRPYTKCEGRRFATNVQKVFCEILKQLWKSTYLCSWKIRWRTSSIKWNSSWRFPNGKKTFWRWQHRNRKHRHLRKSSRRTLHLAVTSRWPDTSDSRADEFMTPSCPFHFWSSEQRDGKFARRCMDMIYPSNYFCPFSSISRTRPTSARYYR